MEPAAKVVDSMKSLENFTYYKKKKHKFSMN